MTREKALTSEQLEGRACKVCGSTEEPLITIGHQYTEDREGGRLGRPEVVCPAHARGRR